MPTWSPTRAALALSLPGHRPDPALEALLRRWLLLGLLAVALVPALRGSSAWFGWWPMWLVAMPAVAWWALHRFRLPASLKAGLGRRPRRGAQARRRARRAPAAAVLPRAA